ncbi:MAG: division/cell wall cluster transcriptional repressor MraZ [Sphingomonas sp.]|nr:division/cell wall cluster transcriptional repressor MraZ [Sphingomonas sp.]
MKGIYQGYALQLVDDKGRVAIPSSLRATLVARNPAGIDPKDASTVVIGMHESDPCLIGYDAGFAERLHTDLAERARAHAGADGAPRAQILRSGMAAEALAFDASGRFIMPGFPRKRVKIGKYAFFYGMGDHFEIWDPATLVACDTAAGVMKDAVRYFMEERGEVL